jgi:RNA polymerase sigma factor (sigma-70 family)
VTPAHLRAVVASDGADADASGPADDESLVRRARVDPDAFALLFRRHAHAVHGFAYRRSGSREVAEEVTAATFERAWRALPSFTWRGGGLEPWLFRIAAGELAGWYRRERRHHTPRAQLVLREMAGNGTTHDDAGSHPEVLRRPESRGGGRRNVVLATDLRRHRPPRPASASFGTLRGGHAMRTDRRRLHERLERMGGAAVPPPSPDFLVRTEERLRSLRSVTLVEDEVGAARARRRGPWLTAAAAAAAVVALVVAVPEGDQDTVSVTTGGTTSTSVPSSTIAPTPTTTTTAAPDATPTSVPGTVPSPPAAVTPTTTSVPTRARPSTTTTAPAAPTTAVTEPAPPATTTSTTVATPIAKLDLRCEAGTDELSAFVTCTWAATTDPAFAGWRLHRAAGSDVKRLVWSSDDGSVRTWVDRDVVAGSTYQYAVEAVTATGRTIAKGGVVSVACCGP